MAKRKLVVEILGDNRQFRTATGGAQQDLGKFEGALGGLGKKIAGAFAVGAIVNFGKQVVTAALEEEAAMSRLETTLRNATGANDEQVAAVERSIKAMQDQFAVSDDELRPAFETLVRKTKDVAEANDLLALALDVSAGSGKSLADVSKALVVAQGGSTKALRDLGIELKTATGETASFEAIQKDLAALFSGQAAKAADTSAGKMKALGIQFEELQEEIGAKLLPAVLEFGKALSGLLKQVTPLIGPLAKVAGILVDIAKYTSPVYWGFQVFNSALNSSNEALAGLQEAAKGAQPEVARTGVETRQAGLDMGAYADQIFAAAAGQERATATTKALGFGTARLTSNIKALADAHEIAARMALAQDRAWDQLTGALSQDEAILNLQQSFDDLATSYTDAMSAAAAGSEDAEQKIRDHHLAVIGLKQSVIDYGRDLGGLPVSVVTRINALIDANDLITAENQLKILARNRKIQLEIEAKGGAGYGSGKARASGGQTSPGVVRVGEHGPEDIILGVNSYVKTASQTQGGGRSTTAAAPIIVHVTVQGSVVSEGRLVDAVHEGLLRKQKRVPLGIG